MKDKLQALPLLEAIQRILNNGALSVQEQNRLITLLIVFYSQSFKPEMITEYFEGWEADKRRNDTYWDDKGLYTLRITEFGLMISSSTNNSGLIPIPRTLCRFIDHCYDAGLPLFLNDKALEKCPALG